MAATLDLGNLLVHLRADASQYLLVMAGVEKKMLATAASMQRIGTRMSLAVTVPLALVGGAATKAFGNFDDAMTKSLAIMGDVSDGLRDEMEKTALEISVNGVTAAKELARSYFFLASAGLSAEQSIASLATVERFAVAGAFDMARATDLVTDAQSALGLTVKDAQKNMTNMTRVADVLTGANTLANASTEQFAESLTSQAGPAMKAFGIQLEEGVAVLAAYADQGIKAQNSGNLFSRMLRLMTKGFRENTGAWQQLGINIFNADGSLRPLADTINDLSTALETMSTRQKGAALDMLGFQARSQQAILPLLGLGDRIRLYNEKLLLMKGITEEIAEKQLKSFNSQIKILRNRIVAVGIQIGSILAPKILKLNEHIKNAIDEWNKLNDSTKAIIVNIGLVTAAIGPMLLAMSLAMKAAAFMFTPFIIGSLKVLLAIAAIKLAFADLNQVFGDKSSEGGIGTFFFNEFKIVQQVASQVVVNMMKGWEHIKFGAKQMVSGIKAGFFGLFNFINDKFGDLIVNIGAGAKKIEDVLNKIPWVDNVNIGANALIVFGKAMKDASKVNPGLEDMKRNRKELQKELKLLETLGQEIFNEIEADFGGKGRKGNSIFGVIGGQSTVDKLLEELGKVNASIVDMTNNTKISIAAWENFKKPIQEWGAEAANVAARSGEVFADAFDRMGDELATFVLEGKSNFADFAKSVLKDLLAIAIRAQIVMPIAQALGFIPGAIGPTSTAGAAPSMDTLAGGGVSFGNAQRFHNGGVVGLRPNEIPIIAERGETILPKGSGGGAPNIIINNNTGQEFEQQGQLDFNGEEWVVNIIAKNVNENGALRQIFGGLNR